jgi:cyanuric acid amidohydrolase
MKNYQVYRLPMAGPDDVSQLEKLLVSKTINPQSIAAILAQTEGDGYARGYSALNFQLLLEKYTGRTRQEINASIPMLMIGLTGGLMSPHYSVLTREEIKAQPTGKKRFTFGIAETRVLLPEEYGTREQALLVAEAVKAAIKDAGITDFKDIHCVEVKCPNLTATRVADAESRGQKVVSKDFGVSGAKAKGASALGVAIALGEVNEKDVTNEAICTNWNLYSNVASTSAGTEQVACRVIVMGNSTQSASNLVIGSGVMKDTLDLDGAFAAFKSAGLQFNERIPADQAKKVAAVYINAGADAMGSIRGRRTTMKSDFLAGYQGIFAKAVINAIVGSLIGDTMILASAGYEHQGALGSNLVAVIAEAQD